MTDLKQYKEKNKLTWDALAEKIGISKRHLFKIVDSRTPNTTVWVAIKIKNATGLEPHEYLDGLDAVKKIRK